VPANGATYIKIMVPNFNGDDSGGSPNPMASYLRIGAIEPGVTPGVPNAPAGTLDNTGEDLASLVTGFADDARMRDPLDIAEVGYILGAGTTNSALSSSSTPLPPAETLPPGTTAPSTVPQDTPSPSGISPGTPSIDGAAPFPGTLRNRLAESKSLHTKGGWRDHSDGNRITTTRGDKVEVIRGNYRMVILGRRDDVAQAAGWDISGGLVDADGSDLDATHKLTAHTHDANNIYNVDYAWERDSNGRWGWTQTTLTGSFSTAPDPTNNVNPPGNGKQISITWVDEVQSFMGGPALGDAAYAVAAAPPPVGGDDGEADGKKRVNRIYNRTWVNVLDEATDAAGSISESLSTAGDYDESYSVTGTHNLNTSAGTENDTLKVGGTLTSLVTAQNMSETVQVSDGHSISSEAGHLNERLVVHGIHTITDASVAKFEFDMAAMSLAFNVTLLIIEIKALIHIDYHTNHFDIHLVHNDFHLGPHFTIDAVPSVAVKDVHTAIQVLQMIL
jgi:hypothetical protein